MLNVVQALKSGGAGGGVGSLLRGVVLSRVHRPDDDDLLQTRGGRGRRAQLLHQSVQGVRVDGLLLVGLERHLFCGGERMVGGLRLKVVGGVGGRVGGVVGDGFRRRRGFRVGGGGFGVGRLAFGDGDQTFVFLGELALDKRHGMTGSQEDDCGETRQKLVSNQLNGFRETSSNNS